MYAPRKEGSGMKKETLHMRKEMKKGMVALLCVLCAMSLMGCAALDRNDAVTQSPAMNTSPSPQALNSAAPGMESLYKDGTYTAQTSQAYAQQWQGWREYVTVTISNGNIAQVEYDAEKDGKKKSQTTQEEYPMEPHPSQWSKQLSDNLKASGSESALADTVTGATSSSQTARRLYAAALNAARTGNTQTVTLADDMQQEQAPGGMQNNSQENMQDDGNPGETDGITETDAPA